MKFNHFNVYFLILESCFPVHMVYIDKTELNVGNVAVANLDVLSITKGIKDMGIFDPPASCYHTDSKVKVCQM